MTPAWPADFFSMETTTLQNSVMSVMQGGMIIIIIIIINFFSVQQNSYELKTNEIIQEQAEKSGGSGI